jgi:hypothetical protein
MYCIYIISIFIINKIYFIFNLKKLNIKINIINYINIINIINININIKFIKYPDT